MMFISLFTCTMAIANQIPSVQEKWKRRRENGGENGGDSRRKSRRKNEEKTEESRILKILLLLQKQLRQQKRQQRQQQRKLNVDFLSHNMPIFIDRYPLPKTSRRQFSEFSEIYALPSNQSDEDRFLVGSST